MNENNPLVKGPDTKYGTIPFSQLSASDYKAGVEEGIRLADEEIERIAANVEEPTLANTVVAFDRAGEALNRSLSALSNLESALGSDELMSAMSEVIPAYSEHNSKVMLNEKLWQRVKHVHNHRADYPNLSNEDLRLIEETYDSFILAGADLKGADREKMKEINSRLSQLSVQFGQNVSNGMKEESRRLWVMKEDLAGIPDKIVANYRQEAKRVLESDGKEDDPDKYLVTVYAPSYIPFMKYAANRELRKKLYMLYNSRNSSGAFDNRKILKEIVNLRLELANLLGKSTFAEYRLQNTMAKTPARVMDFLESLRLAYTEPMRKELSEIEEYARRSEGADFKLEPWDYSYWYEKLRAKDYAFSDEDIKPYFEINNTIEGVFGLATKLYGYRFVETDDIENYHPDVRVYEVFKPNGELLGLLYADFYYREGKSPGAWMTEYRTETKDDTGARNIPHVSIVCNFSKPTGDQPVLLTPGEVETFLHEFGHALHGLSAEAKYESLSGTNVLHDFVELFSQFNENYLRKKEFLDGFARHYETGEPMSEELLGRFIASSQFGAAYACMRQLEFGYLDMAYHSIQEPLGEDFNTELFEYNAKAPVRTFGPVEGCSTSPSFGHIFSGGYAAGYYGYKWSEALDADAFAAFEENGIFDLATAARFLRMLQAGDTEDPNVLYREFRGKDPGIEALMKRDGII